MKRRDLLQALALVGAVPASRAQAPTQLQVQVEREAERAPAQAEGTVHRLQPGDSLAALLAAARDGDTIEVMPGTHRAQAGVILQRRLTLRGVGPVRPVLQAEGAAAEGKGLLVVRNAEEVRIQNLEFRGARVPDRNGAGIRHERGRLLVQRCGFFDNEMGIQTASDPDTALEVQGSEFGRAARDTAQEYNPPHLLYAGRIRRLRVAGCHFHDGYIGHLLKSRARENIVKYNLLVDGAAGEASYELEFPEGGLAWVVGNVIGQGARTQNPDLVSFGAESSTASVHGLYMAHNTFINERSAGGTFVRVGAARLAAGLDMRFVNNLLLGTGSVQTGAQPWSDSNRSGTLAALQQPAGLNFRLVAGSPLRGTGVAPGSGGGRSLAPAAEFQVPLGTRAISAPAVWTPGAFQ
ncbi:hypothetical protein [Azohydromonas caseinilytica]|uniref:Right handed beta helix region n=1 Tax=Azohydromonas caseinilytica TaxID=2728836 RepID=A0A848F051_9BURK|nr:hypothetical protein [Azohydromonas caseinilytica]NML13437.1 hypothetical protein [Azohydromonas caseinilytica]